jgi:outer membrane protein assembly factor BamB/Spy/CpxP family protein refolding chaperone
MTRKFVAGVAVLLTWVVADPGVAGPPVGWRHDGSGRFPDAAPPTEWSVEKNVLWKVPLPAASYATPVVVGDRLVVVSEPADVLCVNRTDGKVLWRASLSDVKAPAAQQRGPGGRGGFGGGRGGFGRPPQPGQVLPAPLQNRLRLSDEQKKDLQALQKDVDARLGKILTEEQQKQLREGPGGAGRGGRGGPGGRNGFGGPPQPGQLLPTALQDRLKLNANQKKDVAALQKDVDTKLAKILTESQQKQLKQMRAGGGRGGPGGRGGFTPPPPGQILPVFLQDRLELTDKQKKDVQAIQKDVDAGLAKLLSEEQKKQLKERPGGGFGSFTPPGQVLSGATQDRLKLTDAQKKDFAAIQKDVDARLEKALSAGQNKQLKEMRDRMGRFGRGGPGGGRGGPGGGGMGNYFGMSAGNTAATPASDGKHIAFVLGNGVVAVYTSEGKRLWARFVESPVAGFGHGSSPVLVGGRLVVHLKDLVALDVATGKELWRAGLEAGHATAAVTRLGKEDVLVSPAGAVVRARDGKVLARGEFHAAKSSPVLDGDTACFFDTDEFAAVKLSADEAGKVTVTPLWSRNGSGGMHHLPSALAHNGLLYVPNMNGFLDLIDIKTGKNVYRQRLPLGQIYSSATLGGGNIYVFDMAGKAVVFKPGRRFERVAVNELERTGSCPVFAGDHLYVRGEKHLYCLSGKGSQGKE